MLFVCVCVFSIFPLLSLSSNRFILHFLNIESMQIKATFSEDGKYVISGSETGGVYIWNRHPVGLAAEKRLKGVCITVCFVLFYFIFFIIIFFISCIITKYLF